VARIRRFFLRLYNLFRAAEADRELSRELDAHVALIEDDCRRRGLSPSQARRAARMAIGGVQQAKEQHRASRSFVLLDDLWRDASHAIRGLAQSPGFTTVVVLTLALGIGATTAIFSVVNGVLLRPLLVPGGDRLVRFITVGGGESSPVAGAQEFTAWREQTAFDGVSAHRLELINVTGVSAPEEVPVARVSAEFFSLFQAHTAVGRVFTSAEDRVGGPAVALLSHELWARRFDSAPTAIGQTMTLGNTPYQIIGVLAEGFDSQQFNPLPDVWLPFQINPDRIDAGNLFLVSGRLNTGATLDMANAQLAVARAAFEQSRGIHTRVAVRWSAQPLQQAMAREVQLSLWLLLGAVMLVLLIACANVASLFIVRSHGRQREIAIRIAIGAGRGRIIRQLLTECIMLATAGSVLGLVVAVIAVRVFLAAYPSNDAVLVAGESDPISRIASAGIGTMFDWRVLAFTIAMSALATLAFGLLPALQCARTDVQGAMKGVVRGSDVARPRSRALLVVGEIALAVVLVIGAALLTRTFLALRAVNPGFTSDHVLTMRMSVSGTRFDTRNGIEALTRDGDARVRAVAGVQAASTTCCMPLEIVWQLPFVIGSRAGAGVPRLNNSIQAHAFGGWTFVSPGYFDVFRIPLLKGRDFTVHDDASAPGVVIINEAMARRFWPNDDPLQDRLIIGRGMRPEYEQDPIRQIIGIVGNVRDTGLNREPRPAMYVPVAQVPDGVTALNVRLLPLVWIVRTGPEPYSLARPVAKALESASGGLPVSRIRSMSDVQSESTARTEFDMWLMTIFGSLAGALAAIGIYGLVAYVVRQRTREIGIRLALGQRAGSIRNLVLKEGIWTAVAGAVVGVAIASLAVRLLVRLLFGVKPNDPLLYAMVSIGFVVVAGLASWVPARRAMNVDSLRALRYE